MEEANSVLLNAEADSTLNDTIKAMPYLALIDNEELELADEAAVAVALKAGHITPETWIADVDVEADWETVEERFPELCHPE